MKNKSSYKRVNKLMATSPFCSGIGVWNDTTLTETKARLAILDMYIERDIPTWHLVPYPSFRINYSYDSSQYIDKN